jgi:hypothetical protein
MIGNSLLYFPYKNYQTNILDYYSHIYIYIFDFALYVSIPRGIYIKLKQVFAMCPKN